MYGGNMSDKKIITYEMTGSPKESGFKTKSELIEYLRKGLC